MFETIRSLATRSTRAIVPTLLLACCGISIAHAQTAVVNVSSPAAITEGDGGTTIVTFNITCDPCDVVNAIVNWSTMDGTATVADNDYVAKSGQIDDMGNGTSVETYPVEVTVNGDLNFEGDETFSLKITSASVGCPSLGGPGGCPTPPTAAVGTATILNDDVMNQPPTAEANGPYAVLEGGSVGLSSAGSSDPDGDPLTFEWDLDNNGSFETPGASPSFSAAGRDGPDTQIVVLRVSDGTASATDTATVEIGNVAPSVAAVSAAPEPSNEGVSVTASAAFTDPGTPDTHTCTLDFGDGSGSQPGAVAGNVCSGSHVYVDDNPTGTPADLYAITVTVTDDDGGSGIGAGNHQVSNVAPTVGPVTVDSEPSQEGESIQASAPFTDPGLTDTHTCTVDYGDGSGPQPGTVAGGTCTGPAHAYVDDDPSGTASDVYTVTIEVTDDDTGSDSNTGAHVVENVAPTVGSVVVSPEPSDEGSAVTASADFSDPGLDDTFTCTVDYGDGLGPVPGTVAGSNCDGPAHTYADNGIYSVTIEVTDDDTGAGSNSANHQVDNVDPTIRGTSNSAAECGETAEGGLVEVSADFSDPGFDNPIAGTLEDFDASEIDWGDGTVEPATVVETPGGVGTPTTGTASGTHMYATGGIFTITVTVRDDDGGSDAISLIALVTGAGLNAGEAQVVGTNAKDVINIQEKGGQLEVKAGFLTGRRATFPIGDVNSLRVLACDGDDQVHVNHDVLVPAILEGGAGRDHVRAGSGLSHLLGGPGDDHLFGGDFGAVLEGGADADSLSGGRGPDVLLGDAGDDRLFGRQGDDLLDGGPDSDTCRPGPGNDVVVDCEQ